jgi:hypothetical protein
MSLWSSIKAVPGGFGKLYRESKHAYALKEKLVKTREERELLRSNAESLRTIALFFLLQLPPVVGYLCIIIGVQFPKQILTHHFWNDLHIQQFLGEDFDNRKHHTRLLLKERLPEAPTLTDIHSRQLRLLAGSHSIFENHFALAITPPFLLRRWLNDRARYIVRDDSWLIEETIDKINKLELQRIGIKRGCDPCGDEVSLNFCITMWLSDEKLARDRAEFSARDKSEQERAQILFRVLYAIALRQLENE